MKTRNLILIAILLSASTAFAQVEAAAAAATSPFLAWATPALLGASLIASLLGQRKARKEARRQRKLEMQMAAWQALIDAAAGRATQVPIKFTQPEPYDWGGALRELAEITSGIETAQQKSRESAADILEKTARAQKLQAETDIINRAGWESGAGPRMAFVPTHLRGKLMGASSPAGTPAQAQSYWEDEAGFTIDSVGLPGGDLRAREIAESRIKELETRVLQGWATPQERLEYYILLSRME